MTTVNFGSFNTPSACCGVVYLKEKRASAEANALKSLREREQTKCEFSLALELYQ